MTAKGSSKAMLSVRTVGAVLAAVFALLAAGCANPGNTGPVPAPAPTAPSTKSAPAF
jgi:hypothetical protein